MTTDHPQDTPRLIWLDAIGKKSPTGRLIDEIHVKPPNAQKINLTLTVAKYQKVMSSPPWTRAVGIATGYIAGTGTGIVTVGGVPQVISIFVADTSQLYQGFTHQAHSLLNGHYLIDNLDPKKRYLLLAKDNKGDYQPCAYDNISPADDLTSDELAQLWQQMRRGNA